MLLIDKIKNTREISHNSLNTYNNNLKKLFKLITGENKEELEIEDMTKLKDVELIMNKLKEKLKPTTIKNYLVAVLVGLRCCDKKFEKEIDEYTMQIKKLSDEVNDNYDENEKNSNQKKNWLDHSEVLKVLKEIKAEVTGKKLLKLEELNDKDLDLLQQYLVLSIYSGKYFPPVRNDFSDMKIIDEKDYNPERDTKNYFVNKKPTPYFILNSYKTARKYGTQKIEIKNINLKNLIKKWIQYNPTEYFLINTSNKSPMTSNGISKYIQKIFNRKRNKNISSSLLRSIYITAQYEKNLNIKNKKELAKDMLHSKGVSEQIYNKIN